MDRIKFLNHGTERILLLDFSGLVPEELETLVGEAKQIIHAEPEASVLTLTKVDGARFNSATVSLLKKFAKANEPYVKRAAIVGLEGLQKFVLDAVSKFTRREFYVCGTVDEAKERLTGTS